MKIHPLKYVLTALLLISFAPCARAELPVEAQDAMNKGVAAAQQKDYPQAIAYFEEARKTAPDASVLYYNLGLAEAEIPGRELRAMTWLGAYLAAEPHTSNTKAIGDRIAALDASSSNTIASLIRVYHDSSVKRAADPTDPDLKSTLLWREGSLWAKAGDIAHAKESLDAMSYVCAPFLGEIAVQQAKGGDYAGAQQTTDRIVNSPYDKYTAELGIAAARWDAGDAAGAKNAIDQLLQKSDIDPSTVDEIVALQARHGDYESALRITGLMQHPDTALISIAVAQGAAGDTAGSDKTTALIPVYPEATPPKDEVAKGVAEAKEQRRIAEDASVSAWLKLFDPRGVDAAGADLPYLNEKYFADVVAYVKAIPTEGPSGFQAFLAAGIEPEAANDPGYAVERLNENTEKMINLRATIRGMFKQMSAQR